MENLSSLIEGLCDSDSDNVKVCVSSRPEVYLVKRLSKYRQVRLQDLTEADIEICIREELNHFCTICSLVSFNLYDYEKIVSLVKWKTNGVFLWVHYALHNLIRGTRNADDFSDLLKRIESLPSGMHELYLQMWKRLNGDELLYRDQAATYFFYSLDLGYPLSIFEMLVALDSSLQKRYLDSGEPQDKEYLVEQCKKLESRIMTRCAGLLEMVDGSFSVHDPRVRLGCDPLKTFHETKIQYLHRTARDFLLSTNDGKGLLGNPTSFVTLAESIWKNVTIAKLAALTQRVQNPDEIFIFQLLRRIEQLLDP